MPRVLIDTALPLHLESDEAWEALMAANDKDSPDVLVRGNTLVRMTERGDLEDYVVESLREHLSRVAQFTKTNGRGVVSDVDPPKDVVQVLLARDSAQYYGAPRVDRVIDVPVVGASGGLVDEPGHHASDRLYYRPDPRLGVIQPVPVASTDDVARARDYLLNELLGDFDFAESSDRAHALGLLLLPFVREFIGEHPTPLHAVFAPEHGAGKTTLARAALMPGVGDVAMSPGAGKNEEEWRKQITSALLSGAGAIVFDNLSGTLDSPALASALTTGTWSDRMLGKSQTVTLPVRNAWVATGNNLDLSDEQVRRVVPIFLEPRGSTAAERQTGAFRHPDLLGWAQSNRKALAQAALTLVSHWLEGEAHADESGMFSRMPGASPVAGRKTLGSFTRWGQVIGGLLESCGVPGFLENRQRLRDEANEHGMEVADFLRSWHAANLAPMTLREVVQCCSTPGHPLRENLPTDLVFGRQDDLHKRMASWLREHHKRKLGGCQLLSTTERRRLWYVRQLTVEQP